MYDIAKLMEIKEEIDRTYAELSPRADLLYDFIFSYMSYIYQARDYGSGESMNMAEVHTLTMIETNPGITLTELAEKWQRTKGAISQNVSKLLHKKLVYRQKDPKDNKTRYLFTTEKGTKLSTAHKMYDNNDIAETNANLLKTCTDEEIEIFYKVLGEYRKLL